MSSNLQGTYISSDVGEILTFTGTGTSRTWTRTNQDNPSRNITDGTGTINGNIYNGISIIKNESVTYTIIDENTIQAPAGRTYMRTTTTTIGLFCNRNV
jgi:hypothetical protein